MPLIALGIAVLGLVLALTIPSRAWSTTALFDAASNRRDCPPPFVVVTRRSEICSANRLQTWLTIRVTRDALRWEGEWVKPRDALL